MKLITQRDVIKTVAARWRAQYHPFEPSSPLFSERNGITVEKTKREIADELDALNKDTATVADVTAIIGNDSWTDLKCDECGKYVDAIVQVGEEPDYESYSAKLCKPCVYKALTLAYDIITDSTTEEQHETL